MARISVTNKDIDPGIAAFDPACQDASILSFQTSGKINGFSVKRKKRKKLFSGKKSKTKRDIKTDHMAKL